MLSSVRFRISEEFVMDGRRRSSPKPKAWVSIGVEQKPRALTKRARISETSRSEVSTIRPLWQSRVSVRLRRHSHQTLPHEMRFIDCPRIYRLCSQRHFPRDLLHYLPTLTQLTIFYHLPTVTPLTTVTRLTNRDMTYQLLHHLQPLHDLPTVT